MTLHRIQILDFQNSGCLQVLFAGPLPTFSHRLNAAVTGWTCQWLMGPSVVNDVKLESGEVLKVRKWLNQNAYSMRRIQVMGSA